MNLKTHNYVECCNVELSSRFCFYQVFPVQKFCTTLDVPYSNLSLMLISAPEQTLRHARFMHPFQGFIHPDILLVAEAIPFDAILHFHVKTNIAAVDRVGLGVSY